MILACLLQGYNSSQLSMLVSRKEAGSGSAVWPSKQLNQSSISLNFTPSTAGEWDVRCQLNIRHNTAITYSTVPDTPVTLSNEANACRLRPEDDEIQVNANATDDEDYVKADGTVEKGVCTQRIYVGCKK